MSDLNKIYVAMLRLSRIAQQHYHYDHAGEIFGDGPIHFLVEVGKQFFIAWEDNATKTIIVNLITRFELAELEELGAAEAWTVVHVPAIASEGIQFRDIDNIELCRAYHQTEAYLSSAVEFLH